MRALRRVVNEHPLTAFFILAYTLSWWSAPLTGGQLLPHGPFLAALIVLALTQGRNGLAGLFGQMTRWRVGWRWYLIAPGIVVVYLLGALAINLLLGATITETSHLRPSGIFGARFLELLLLGGMWEEPGWTGYALPRLQGMLAGRRHGLLKASLLMAAFRAIWHLPLMIYGHIPWYDVFFFTIAFQFIITWLYNRTGGSVLIVMLFHLASNVIGGGLMVPLFTGVDYTRYYILFVLLAWVAALLLVYPAGWSMGRREARPAQPDQMQEA